MLYFADTYALMEFVQGNKNYDKYFTENDFITNRLNLMELYYWTCRDVTEEKADEFFNSFLNKTVDIDDETFKKAAKFRLKHKKANISYIDAIGYEIAQSKKIPFLTGDQAFKTMQNVEFVK